MKSLKSRILSKAAHVVACCLMLSVATIAGTAFADQNDTYGDAQIQAMRPDIVACTQSGVKGEIAKKAFSEKYGVSMATIERIFANNSRKDKDPTSLEILACDMEIGSQIFQKLWADRAKGVNWSCGGENKFCYQYSANCNHLVYSKDCALSKLGSCVKK